METPSDFVAKVAVELVAEVFKSSLKGLKSFDSRMRGKTKGLDPLGIAARKYAEHLEGRYNVMRIFGMNKPIPLRGLYVNVNILEKPTSHHRISARELGKLLDHDRRSFGYIRETRPGINVVNANNRLSIIGKPGAGKTTFLKLITLSALDGTLSFRCLPIFVGLKKWADTRKSLFDFIVDEFDVCGFPEADVYVERLLRKGKCLVLFDGYDEMPNPEEGAISSINDFTEKYSHNRFILSCRIAAYNYVFEKFTVVEMADFNDGQMKAFIKKWFVDDSEKARRCWEEINKEANKPIKELGAIPLLLTMLCLAFNETLGFPSNRAELYKEAIDALLKKWDVSRNISRHAVYKRLSLQRKESLLSSIACKTFENRQYFIPGRTIETHIADFIRHIPGALNDSIKVDSHDVLKAIESHHGLIVERAHNIYSFSHLTFQEYFTAKYIVDHQPKDTLKRLVDIHSSKDSWREVVLLTTGMLPEADQLLLLIREKIAGFTEEEALIGVLRMISECTKNESPYTEPATRALAIFIFCSQTHSYTKSLRKNPTFNYHRYERDEEADHASELDRSRTLAYNLACALDTTLAIDFAQAGFNYFDSPKMAEQSLSIAQAVDIERAISLDGTFSINFARYLNSYLKNNILLKDCLETECYVSNATRQKIEDGFLTEMLY